MFHTCLGSHDVCSNDAHVHTPANQFGFDLRETNVFNDYISVFDLDASYIVCVQ